MLSNSFQIAAEEAIRFRGIPPCSIHISFTSRISVSKSLRKNLIPNGVLYPCRSIKNIDSIQVWKTEKAIIIHARRKTFLSVYGSLITIMELKHVHESVIFR
ncbi:hypothetical protein D3C78_1329260 [compost metagenome]